MPYNNRLDVWVFGECTEMEEIQNLQTGHYFYRPWYAPWHFGFHIEGDFE